MTLARATSIVVERQVPREVAEVRRCAPLLVAEDVGRTVSAVPYQVTSGGQRSRTRGFESRLPRVPLQDSGA